MQRSSSRALHGLDAIKCCRHQIRFQSTGAPAPKLSFAEFTTGVDATSDASPAKTRRTPRLSALGDIVIPSNFRTSSADGPKIIPHRAPSKDYSPSLKWISDDQTGASFSVRAAKRRAQQVYAQRQPDEEGSTSPPAPSTDLPAAGQLLTRASQLNKSFKELGQGKARNGKQQERKTEWKSQRGNSQEQQRPSVSAQAKAKRPEQQKKAPVAEIQSRSNRERTPRQRPSPPPPPKTPRGLLVDLQTTDLTQLFSTPPVSPANSSAVHAASEARSTFSSKIALRIQLSKERAGGDYSRHLPPQLVKTMGVRALGPVHHAALVLARRREAGLRTRRHGLEVVQKMVGMTDELVA